MPVYDDPSESLALLVIQLRTAKPEDRGAVVSQLRPLLANETVPLPLRLAAAGRAIESLPDTTEAIRDLVATVIAGLPPAQAIQRLRYVQNLVEKSDAFDAIVDQAARELQLSCPRCGVALPQADMVKHLWHDHGLLLVEGKTRSLARTAQTIRADYALNSDPASFDSVAELGEPVIGAWAAESATEDETYALRAAAREREAGLCPACFGNVLPGVSPLPPPLVLVNGRVAGDGHSAIAASVFPPRVSATLAAAAALLLFGGCLHFGVGVVLAVAAYVFTYLFCTPRGSPDDGAIDAAWRKLVPRLADRRSEARFLTRLCLTSIGRGDPMERANALQQLVARARSRPDEVQLLAVAQTLQIDDGARFGRDRAEGIANLVLLALQGERSTAFAEYVLAAYLSESREPAERGRLRILLLAAAFAADLTPRDILDLCAAAPHVAEAMGLPAHHLAMLYGVWANQSARPWKKVGEARTVFELADNARTRAGKLLAAEPGLLLVCESDASVEESLGPALITISGVSVGGETILDPASDIRIENDGWALIFGKHTLRLNRPIPATVGNVLKGWLRFRTQVLANYPANYLKSESHFASRLLVPFVVSCGVCGTKCLPVIGTVAQRASN